MLGNDFGVDWSFLIIFCFRSLLSARHIATAESTRRMWGFTTRNGWKSRHRIWLMLQVSWSFIILTTFTKNLVLHTAAAFKANKALAPSPFGVLKPPGPPIPGMPPGLPPGVLFPPGAPPMALHGRLPLMPPGMPPMPPGVVPMPPGGGVPGMPPGMPPGAPPGMMPMLHGLRPPQMMPPPGQGGMPQPGSFSIPMPPPPPNLRPPEAKYDM